MYVFRTHYLVLRTSWCVGVLFLVGSKFSSSQHYLVTSGSLYGVEFTLVFFFFSPFWHVNWHCPWGFLLMILLYCTHSSVLLTSAMTENYTHSAPFLINFHILSFAFQVPFIIVLRVLRNIYGCIKQLGCYALLNFKMPSNWASNAELSQTQLFKIFVERNLFLVKI